MKRELNTFDWIIFLIICCLAGITVGIRASFGQTPVEQTMHTASQFQSWEDELRQREQLIAERNAQQLTANRQAAAALAERIQAHNHDVQQRLQQQQTAATQRETALKAILKTQQEKAALQRLHQGMQMQAILERFQPAVPSRQTNNIPERAYGYSDKTVPEQSAPSPEIKPPTESPYRTIPQAVPPTTIQILQQPAPLATVAPLTTRIKTTINGIDQIETQAVLPSELEVKQLDAVKKIADNGVIIAQQRLGLEQRDITARTALASLSIWKHFVLWGLVLSIPFLMTIFWMIRRMALGWHSWQQDKLDYKLKELASAERQIAMSNKTFRSS